MLTKAAAQDVCDFLATVSLTTAMQKQALEFNPLTGAAFGAGAGGLVGLLGEMRKKKRDRRYLNAILGGVLAGGGLGAGAGLIPQAIAAMRGTDQEKPGGKPEQGGTAENKSNPPAGATKQQGTDASQQSETTQAQPQDLITGLMKQELPWNTPGYLKSLQFARDLGAAGTGAGVGLIAGEPLTARSYVRLSEAARRAADRARSVIDARGSTWRDLNKFYNTSVSERTNTIPGAARQRFYENFAQTPNRDAFFKFYDAAQGHRPANTGGYTVSGAMPGSPGNLSRERGTGFSTYTTGRPNTGEYTPEQQRQMRGTLADMQANLAANKSQFFENRLKSRLNAIPEKPTISGGSRSLLGAGVGAALPYAAGWGLDSLFGE